MTVLVIGDTHIPFEHKKYFDFIREQRDLWKADKIIHIGDVIDNHAISFHESDPDGLSSGAELGKTQKKIKKWYNEFPDMNICIGNHDCLPFRQARNKGISRLYMKAHNDLLETHSWEWELCYEIDNVLYKHGTGKNGKYAHIHWATQTRMSTVTGHAHSGAGVQYLASKKDLIFGMNVGCGIDDKSYAMEYGREFAVRPTLGCGVVLDGERAFFVPMKI